MEEKFLDKDKTYPDKEASLPVCSGKILFLKILIKCNFCLCEIGQPYKKHFLLTTV